MLMSKKGERMTKFTDGFYRHKGWIVVREEEYGNRSYHLYSPEVAQAIDTVAGTALGAWLAENDAVQPSHTTALLRQAADYINAIEGGPVRLRLLR
jgi:hypothetical protein